MPDSPNIKDAADAVKGIVEAVPIYQDLVQPAVQELGKGLQTVAKTVHIVLAPVSALVWGFEQITDFVSTVVAEKLSNTPQEDIIEPRPNVAGPALEALRYTGSESELRELYANLLASSMDRLTKPISHPSFVEAIKQMTPDEAKIIRQISRSSANPIITVHMQYKAPKTGMHTMLNNFSCLGDDVACDVPDNTPSYLDNLERLGLIRINYVHSYIHERVYEKVMDHPRVRNLLEDLGNAGEVESRVDKGMVDITDLGKQFVRTCVVDHRALRPESPPTSSMAHQV